VNEKTINLVDKLREYAVEPGRYWLDNYALQAGHEIERLRREIESLETRLQTLIDKYVALESERDYWREERLLKETK
jgi:ubiquinone biosynthesis protein UbiJ